MARRQGISIDDLVDGDRYVWDGFSGFLAAYDRIAALFRAPDDYRRLAEDYLVRIARVGAVYAELFVSPDHAGAAGLAPQAYIDGIAEGVRAAEKATGIVARLIVVGVRHLGPEAVERAARFAVGSQHPLVTGFGLAGDERVHAPAEFADAFDIAREAGLRLTAHAGEFAGPEAVAETIRTLRVSRLGHGVRAAQDPELMRELAETAVTLEVCPGSNFALGLYPSAEVHPLRTLHEAGVRVTLGSDDPPFFNTSLAAEYAFAEAAGFSAPERLALTRNALEAAFVDEETRGVLLQRLTMDAIKLGGPTARD